MSKKAYVVLGLLLLSLVAGMVAGRRAHRTEAPEPSASASASAPLLQARVAVPFQVAETIYDGKLTEGWVDWGWGNHDLPKQGPAKIVFSGYGGIIFHHTELPSRLGGLSFRYKPPADWPEFLAVSLKRGGGSSSFPVVALESKHVVILADGWREALIPWAELNPSNLPIDGVSIAARVVVQNDPVALDRVVLVKPSASAAAGPVPTRSEELVVACAGNTQPINPMIYGAAGGDWSSGQFAQRIGGNPTTRLNWDAGNLWSTGNDWFFENGQEKTGIWDWLDTASAAGLQSAVTVPMIGWVAKDATSVGFPWSKFNPQRKRDPNRPEAGDGFRPDGTPIRPGPPSQTSVEATPEVIGRWIKKLREKDRVRGKRSAQMYLLDNEPTLWNKTHRDIHPDPVGYDELLDRTIRYGSAIRAADPDAVIAGPTEWGWNGYLYSAKDREAGLVLHPDRSAHGNVPLIPWYLRELANYEKTKGVHILDVLDVHFYPAAEHIYGDNARTDAEGSELRLRSTRALWDPDYVDESWIKTAVQLVPRLKQWVADNYPGRQVSIGEWSFGADDHISGGLATAEALGRFGQSGLDAAFFYGGPKPGTPVFWAFRAFRNFDGKGARFLDISLSTRAASKVSLFASRNAEGTRIVAVMVNLDPVFAIKSQINLDHCARARSRRVFSYGPGSKELVEDVAASVEPTSVVTVSPYSFAVFDWNLEPNGAAP
ncbi:MAG: glycoside hydrolase family 44 protein [Pseudomonadota bacterium]